MAENNVQKLILGFLVLIVGIALIGSVASNTLIATDKTSVHDESLDISGARLGTGDCPMSINTTYPFEVSNVPTGWKLNDCPIASFSMKNQTSVDATVTTDYVVFLNNGTLFLKNTTRFVGDDCAASSNATTLSYTHCADGYMNIAWGRSILNLVAGFFALALLGVSVGIFYDVAKDSGLIGK